MGRTEPGAIMTNIVTGLSSAVGPYHYTTEQMIKLLERYLTDDTKRQIRNLGVVGRYFNTPLSTFILKGEPIIKPEEPDMELVLNVAREALRKSKRMPFDIRNIVCAYERSDWLSPGMSSIVLTKMGFNKWTDFYNLQGHACSSFPRVIEFTKHLPGRTLCIISGVTSPWYQSHWKDDMLVDGHDKSKWVNAIFSFLFGDGAVAFVVEPHLQLNPRGEEVMVESGYNFGPVFHLTNMDDDDYKRAAVRLEEHGVQAYAPKRVADKALEYTDRVLETMMIKPRELKEYDQIFLHTGSAKIIDAYQKYYQLSDEQLKSSREVLAQHGNLTGCSLPFVMNNATFNKGSALMIGIAMGFSVDICEVWPI